MHSDTVTYFNGIKYKRRTRRLERPGGRYSITFAYRGIPDEWPAVISYTIHY